jgi:hypothetical protein
MANWSYTTPPNYYIVGDNFQAALTATNMGWTNNTSFPPEVVIPVANLNVLQQAALAVPTFTVTPPTTPLTGTVTTTGEVALSGTITDFPAVTLTGTVSAFAPGTLTGTISTFAPATLTGTITTSSVTTALSGVGTSFTTQLQIGSTVSYNGVVLGTITSVTNNTTAAFTANATSTQTSVVNATTSGSTTITGSGTSFTTQLNAGSILFFDGTPIGTVASVTNNTTAVLTAIPLIGQSGLTYTTSGTVNLVGSGTAFATQLQVGSTVSVGGTLIGTIAGITSNTAATFYQIATTSESAATATTAGSVNLVGAGTSFTTQLQVGSTINVGATLIGTIASIASNTLATFVAVPTTLESGATATAGGSAAGSTTVTGSGTSFTTQTFVGAELYYGNVNLGVVNSITNNTTLVLSAAALANVTAGTVSTSQSFGTGAVMKFIVVPSAPVNVAGNPTINVSVGANNTVLTYNPFDSTSTALSFEYTVLNTDTATSGNVVLTGSMNLPVGAGVAKQLVGGNEFAVPLANLTFTVPSTIGTIVT